MGSWKLSSETQNTFYQHKQQSQSIFININIMTSFHNILTLIPTCSAHAVNLLHPFLISHPAIQMKSHTLHLHLFHFGHPNHFPHTFQHLFFQSKNGIQTEDEKSMLIRRDVPGSIISDVRSNYIIQDADPFKFIFALALPYFQSESAKICVRFRFAL